MSNTRVTLSTVPGPSPRSRLRSSPALQSAFKKVMDLSPRPVGENLGATCRFDHRTAGANDEAVPAWGSGPGGQFRFATTRADCRFKPRLDGSVGAEMGP